MDQFTPFASTIGGVFIGLAASVMLLLHGKIAGISGIVGGLLQPRAGDVSWRLLFVAGLVLGGTALAFVWPAALTDTLVRSPVTVLFAGLLVGFGTRMGNGCTSGHGVCGLTRFSPRSAAAVATFMTTGAITAYITQQLMGGAL
jgi:uncharacterized membrane protein YedE/YeeE